MEDLRTMLQDYYNAVGISPKSNREIEQVLARQAMMVALRPYTTLAQIGRMFGKHHATAHYALKNHDLNMGWSPMYRFFYETAEEIVTNNPITGQRRDDKLTAMMTRHKMHITELKNENEELNQKVAHLLEINRILERENKNLSQYADRV